MSELTDIQNKAVMITLGGKERELRYRYSAWAKMETEFGSIEGVETAINEKPFANLPKLIAFGIKGDDGTNVSPDTVAQWMDDLGGIEDIKALLEKLKEAITQSLPKGKGKDPTSRASVRPKK